MIIVPGKDVLESRTNPGMITDAVPFPLGSLLGSCRVVLIRQVASFH
jgi:hypothetical protein